MELLPNIFFGLGPEAQPFVSFDLWLGGGEIPGQKMDQKTSSIAGICRWVVLRMKMKDGHIRLWFQTFFDFHSYLGKIPILANIFQMG